MTYRPTRRASALACLLGVVLVASLAVAPPAASSRRVYRTVALEDLGHAGGQPRQTIAGALSERTRGGAQIAFEAPRRSALGKHLRGTEVRAGVPVDGTWVVAWLRKGSLERVEARLSALPGEPTARPIPQEQAVGTALAHVGAPPLLPPVAERYLVPGAGRLIDIWRVEALTGEGPVQVDIDSRTGIPLATDDPAVYEDTTATVFDPNPIVALRDAGVRQPGVDALGVDTDLDEARLASALVPLPIRQVQPGSYSSGRLVGPYVDVQGPAPLMPGNAGFSYTRGDPRFETTMAYAHIDRLQRYLNETLGLTDVNAEPQNVYAVPVPGFDNSFYMSGTDIIVLGSGGVDDGEDAEVILHEYGHAVHDAQVPNWGSTHEGGAMGEGFGDFLAAAFFARTSSKGFQDACVADWDATSYSSDDPACLRRLDTGKRYPEDMEGGVHADGEIWSGFLWKLRARLGSTPAEMSDNSLKLLLTSHELLTPSATFSDAIAALKESARALGHPEWVNVIKQTAKETGLGKN